jgi:hypothetical protein
VYRSRRWQAGPTSAFLVWTDSRYATPCAAVNTYRDAVYGGSKTAVAPNPNTTCSASFGNTDTYTATVAYCSHPPSSRLQ